MNDTKSISEYREEYRARAEFLKHLKVVREFMSKSELYVIADGARGEEREYFYERVRHLAGVIATMPRTYETDGQGDASVVSLHYFTGGCDWWITELDREREQHQAFGLADIGYGGELGYISIVELTENGVELDLHWTPVTLGELRRKREHGREAVGEQGMMFG